MLEVICIDGGFPSVVGLHVGQHCWIDPDSIDVDSRGVRFADIYLQDVGSFTGFTYYSTMKTKHFRPISI